jgi:hypothetical protein
MELFFQIFPPAALLLLMVIIFVLIRLSLVDRERHRLARAGTAAITDLKSAYPNDHAAIDHVFADFVKVAHPVVRDQKSR